MGVWVCVGGGVSRLGRLVFQRERCNPRADRGAAPTTAATQKQQLDLVFIPSLHAPLWPTHAPTPPHPLWRSDEEVRELHPAHTQASIRALLPRLRYFEQGTCIVHHLFGGEVCELVK